MTATSAMRRFFLRLGMVWIAVGTAAAGQTKIYAFSDKWLIPAGASGRPAAGDLDGDGDLDLFTPSDSSLLLNDGTGRFADATAGRVPRLLNPQRAALVDVDGDRDLDVLVMEAYAPHAARLLINDGKASFIDATAGRMPPGSQFQYSIVVGDVDADGDADVALGVSSHVRLLLNDGRGTFTEATAARLPRIEATPLSLALVDVDADGDLDLVSGNTGHSRLYANDGRGYFTDVTSSRLPEVWAYASAIATGDVDGDGDIDLVFGTSGTPKLLLINDGRGAFVHAPEGRLPPDTDRTEDVRLFDADGDGDLDLVCGNTDTSQLVPDRFYRNDGRGYFTAEPSALAYELGGTAAFATGDFDRDGDADLAAARDTLELLLNDGSGVFRDPTPRRMPRDWFASAWIAVADLNGDRASDAIVLQYFVFYSIRLYLADGKGGFLDASARLPGVTLNPTAATMFDVDGDGDQDVYVGHSKHPHWPWAQDQLYLNDGKAGFTEATKNLPPEDAAVHALAPGDFDGDGDQDLILASWERELRLYVNDGRGTFRDLSAGRMPALKLSGLEVGDFDRDGDLDVTGTAGGIYLLVNDGTGRFTDESSLRLPAGSVDATSLKLRDADGDGDLDLFFGNRIAPSAALYVNDGRGFFRNETAARLPRIEFRWPLTFLTDADADGALDLVVSDDYPTTITRPRLLRNDGRGRFADISELWPDEALDPSAFADVDADGDEDVIAHGSGPDRVYSNLTRQVRTPEIARLGRPFPIELLARPGYAVDFVAAKPLLSTGEVVGGVDVPPYGRLWLDPTSMATLLPVLLPPPAGRARIDLTIPNVRPLIGVTLHAQALFFDLRSARLSNVTSDLVH